MFSASDALEWDAMLKTGCLEPVDTLPEGAETVPSRLVRTWKVPFSFAKSRLVAKGFAQMRKPSDNDASPTADRASLKVALTLAV